ncbi:SusC/RagA family TonB-linked outer membrane protein [Cellulophaga omnivescoria]|uniref:SusC/RagA family TonB-linked outer membrane protein n=1 Tax=Cellulophaga omnivescoria TaxID=1888890 RepID=UPI000985EC9C|nr:TonB-dependent receptor [Cellulophaga omnivescoria]WBU90061.1 TonB-dependent receptor [Cellulophaga omnivescoria]WKB82185.1 TonB-dependent receptor [Cellulophaga lytica]
MRTKVAWILTPLLVMLMSFSYAQEKTITGNVTDHEGLALPGVTVLVVGTTTGTQTDFDGNYTIKASVGQILRYSYVGQKTTERKVGSSNTISLQMDEDAEALDEVVVVAYGSQKKKSIVGSVTSLGEEMIDSQQLTTITSAIQGTVAGVNVITSGGQPGSNPTIRIRGIGSINASAEPLIVVDGVPFNGNINSISGDQIESMNILKDASSTALYGSRAANGVVLITTKKGSYNSGSKITVSAVSGFSTPAVALHDRIGNDDMMRYSWEAERNKNLYITGQSATDAGINASQSLISNLGYNPYNVAQPVDQNGNLVPGATSLWETDWEDEMLRSAAQRNEYTVSISGGGESSRFFLSANYLNQEGAVRESDFERFTTRLNLETEVKDWLTVGLNTSLSTSKQNFPTQSGSTFQSSYQWIYSMSSIYPLYRRNENGGLVLDNSGNRIYDYGSTPGQSVNGSRPLLGNENAVGSLYNYDDVNKRTNALVNGFAKIKFSDNLSFKTNLSYENYLFDSNSYDAYDVGVASSVGGRVAQDRDITTTFNFTNSLNYDKTFGDHSIQANAIFEAYKLKVDALGAQGTGFLPGVKVLNGSTLPEGVSGFISEDRLTSYLGRLAYSYKDRYFIEGSYRRDGSSRFSEDTRWGNFFSVGGSWVISDENFLAGSSTINLLKLRASYGELGNNGTSSYFPYLQGFETGNNELDNTGVLLGDVTDPNLTWETSALFNVGLDFSLLNDRLDGSFEYYSKESIDLIYTKPLPISTGNSGITTNVGSIKNSGYEMSLTGRLIQNNKVTWTLGVNAAINKNEITELTQDEFITGTKKWKEGKSLYDFFIQDWAGVDPEDGYGMWYKDVLDVDGNPTGERETTKDYSEATRYYQGSSLPDVTGGLTTDLKVGGFDFNMLFNFSFGAQVYDSSYAGLMDGFSRPGYTASPDIANRWTQPGDITDVPLLLNSQNDFNGTSTRFLFDNDYVRLRAITLGYTLPSDITKKAYLDNVRIYLRGDNLFTWQSHKGIDPEQSLAGTTDSRSSLLKTISLGLNVQF